MPAYHVRISQDTLAFSAAHFITIDPRTCESLHGHNYRVAAEVHGPLDENSCVVDFLLLRDTLSAIVGTLDHRMLLPGRHPSISVENVSDEIEVRFGDRRWCFPRGECTVLPVANPTAEALAQCIAEQLLDTLQSKTGKRPASVRVEVEESPGLSAVCRLDGEETA